MRNLLTFTFLLFFSLASYAQLDRSTGATTVIKGLGVTEEVEENTYDNSSRLFTPGIVSLSNLNSGLLIDTQRPFKLTDGKEKKTFSMRTDNGLKTFKNENFKPKAFEDSGIRTAHKKDQHLGDLTTSGKYVELYCRDHQYVDGDKIKIVVNGEVIHHSITLGGGYTPIFVKLNNGFNNIEFHALNQGESGPNTAELLVLDEDGRELTRKEWNLLTGAKASIIVVKQ